MKTIKPILIGAGILAVIGGVFFLAKNKNINDDSTGGNVEFDFNNASGNTLVDVLNKYKTKKIIPVKKYQTFIKNANISELKKYLAGKNIYTLVDNVKIRETPKINNGLIDNIAGVVKKKGTFIGKVSFVEKRDDGYFWLGITENYSNKFISSAYDFSKDGVYNPTEGLYSKTNPKFSTVGECDIIINWVRADVVVVDISDERALTDAYSNYIYKD